MRVAHVIYTAGCLALMCSTAVMAELTTNEVEFNFNFTSGEFPGSEVQQWSTTHVDLLTYDETSGRVFTTLTEHVDMTFAIGDEVITATVDASYAFQSSSYEFDMSFVIPEAPLDYGPMTIDISGDYDFNGNWAGTFTATLGPGSGFGAAEYTGDWNAQVIPAPAGVALIGIAGLAGRRRRSGSA